MISRFIAFLARLITGVPIHWSQDSLDLAPRIYFANHSSHFDFITIWAALPPEQRSRTRPVAAADYWNRNSMRRYLATRVFRAVLIDRRKSEIGSNFEPEHLIERRRAAIDQMAAVMNEGDSLIIFPEGTRGDGRQVAPFKSGLYYLVMARPKAQLIPIRIDNLNRLLPKGTVIPLPVIARLTFGSPIYLADDEARDSLLERARTAIMELKQGPRNEPI